MTKSGEGTATTLVAGRVGGIGEEMNGRGGGSEKATNAFIFIENGSFYWLFLYWI